MPPRKRRELTQEEAMQRAVKFSERYVERGPYEFFPEGEVVTVVQEGLAENERQYGYRYCP
jgi:ferredoxin-thioredoxin reductase catalytic subunit